MQGVSNPAYRHGQKGKRIYIIWNNMKQRCGNPNATEYTRYGGQGITVCEEWMDFAGFYRDMAPGYSDDMTLERIDNTKGYCKENCRWATRLEQSRNKRNVPLFMFQGKMRALGEIATIIDIKKDTLYRRIKNYGWSLEEAINTPITPCKP